MVTYKEDKISSDYKVWFHGGINQTLVESFWNSAIIRAKTFLTDTEFYSQGVHYEINNWGNDLTKKISKSFEWINWAYLLYNKEGTSTRIYQEKMKW